MSFFSKSLGRTISAEDLASLPLDDLEDVCTEIAVELTTVNSKLRRAGQMAAATRTFMPQREWGTLHDRRAVLGPLHQQALQVAKKARRAAEQAQRQANEQEPLPPLEVFFMRVARNMLEPAQYQLLTVAAEQRRAAEVARHRNIAV